MKDTQVNETFLQKIHIVLHNSNKHQHQHFNIETFLQRYTSQANINNQRYTKIHNLTWRPSCKRYTIQANINPQNSEKNWSTNLETFYKILVQVTRVFVSEMQKATDMYSRYICACLSKAVLIFGPCTDRNRNREHCAIRSMLLTLWPAQIWQ